MGKAQKNLKDSLFAIFILVTILSILTIFNMITNKLEISLYTLILRIAYNIFLFYGYTLAKQGKKTAGIIGSIVGILMMTTIINGSIIDFLLGLFLFIHSLKYNKEFK